MKTIYGFKNYRTYLSAVYREKKKNLPRFTWTQFAKNLGFTHLHHLKLILDEQRNLTVKNLVLVADRLSLNMEEKRFFECMVHLNQAQTAEEVAYFRHQMDQILLTKTPESKKQTGKSIFSHWYYPATLKNGLVV